MKELKQMLLLYSERITVIITAEKNRKNNNKKITQDNPKDKDDEMEYQ